MKITNTNTDTVQSKKEMNNKKEKKNYVNRMNN